MSDWQEITLGEISSIEIGGTPSRSEERYWWKSDNDGIRLPWVSISDMKGRVITDTKESITEIGALQSNCKHVPKGTLLMSFKLTIGRLAFAGRDLYTNEAISAIRPTKDVHPEFLYYGLQHWNLTGDSDQAVKGVTLNKQKLQEIPCLLPPLPEQKKIAEILSGIDQAMSSRAAIALKAEEFARGIREDLIARWENTPTKQERIPLGELLKQRKEYRENDGSIPLFSLTIKDGVTPKTDRYNREFLVTSKDTKKYKVAYTNDLVYNPSNLRWGAIARSKVAHPVLLSPIYEIFSCKDNNIVDPVYIEMLCRSNILMARYLEKVEGTLVERTALKLDDFIQIEVPLPPLDYQDKAADAITKAESVAANYWNIYSKQAKLKQSIASDLLSGRKRVSV